MAKSRAEIQKAYRQRLKEKNNAAYLAKERERRRNTYVPNNQLPRKQRSIRNKKNRTYLKKYRAQKRAAAAHIQEQGNEADLVEQPSTSGYESQSDSQRRMVVRINFPNRSNGPRLRVSKELQKTKKQLKTLRENYDNLKRKYRSTTRAIQREKRKACSSPTTPRSKARKLMTGMRLTPDQATTVRKELIFANAVCDEIKSSAKKAPMKTKRLLKNLVVGNVIKKYRTLRKFAGRTGMCRNTLAKIKSKNVEIGKHKRTREVAKHRDKVIEFLERVDNSRNMPGKADSVKTKTGTQIQKRVLTDYLVTLYRKFISENPGIKLSFASFCRTRPNHIILTSLITRDTCLCTKHQNMSLTLKAVKRQNINIPLNGEKMLERKTELIKEIEDNVHEDNNTIVVSQWKRVQIECKGQKKSVMKVINSDMTKKEFLEHVTKQSSEFEEHVSRIKTQYSEMKTLKENLPEKHCIVHMDFSENYSCKSVEEIQSAYWNQTSVTLHPVVVYYKLNTNELQHKSFVFISDEMSHSASTVLTFVDKLIPELRFLNPAMEHIHYWTDSPTSQYRNKIIFNAVANHKINYQISATWNYWESGHGKGPCDGLGGTVKRMADDAVKTGKVCIQDPDDFYAWTHSQFCTMKNVNFLYVETAKCQEKANALFKLKLKPVRGTMKVHAVKGKGNSMISIRNTSCYCEECMKPETTCQTWADECTETENTDTSPMLSQDEHNVSKNKKCVNVQENDYVAAKYLDKWYVGKVLSVDDQDNTVEVSFLGHKKKAFQWPSRPDIIWVDHDQILCKVSQPTAVGKSKRLLQIHPSDMKQVEDMFDQ